MAIGSQLSNMIDAATPAFGERVTTIANEDAKIYNLLALAPRPFDGKSLTEALTGTFPGSSLWLGPNAPSLPAPGEPSITYTTLRHAYFYVTHRVDWDLIAQTSGKNSFMAAWVFSLDRSMADTLQVMEMTTCMNGSGVLNRTTSSSGTGLRSISGVTAANWTFVIHVWDAPLFRPGTRVEVWTGTYTVAAWLNATKRDTPSQGFYTIANVAPDLATGLATVTIKEASPGTNSPANGDYVVPDEGIAQDVTPSTTNATNMAIGLYGHISADGFWLQPNTKTSFGADGTHQDISPTTNSWWKSPTVSAGSATAYLKPDHFEELAVGQNVFSSTAADKTTFYLAHPHQIRQYRGQLVPGERYMVMNETPTLPSGTKSSLGKDTYLTFSDVPLVGSKYADPTQALAVSTKDMKRFQLKGFTFEQRHQDFGNRPAWQQDGSAYVQIGTTDRTSSGSITGLKPF